MGKGFTPSDLELHMNTSFPFGFISYNSHDYLESVLISFIEEGTFSRCACWFHQSMGDEKDHFHCWVEPTQSMLTQSIKDRFIEIDDEGNQNSIALKDKCKSVFTDAYLYGIHDKHYLAIKNRLREQVNIVSDKHIYLGDFKQELYEAETFRFFKCVSPYERIKELVYQGLTLEEVYIKLRTPFAQFRSVSQAYHFLVREREQERLESLCDEIDSRGKRS